MQEQSASSHPKLSILSPRLDSLHPQVLSTVSIPFHVISSPKNYKYCVSDLLSLRTEVQKITRSTRRAIFRHHLWKPHSSSFQRKIEKKIFLPWPRLEPMTSAFFGERLILHTTGPYVIQYLSSHVSTYKKAANFSIAIPQAPKIPVIVSATLPSHHPPSPPSRLPCLIYPPQIPLHRKRKPTSPLPSIFLANLHSILNKLDEVTVAVSSISPTICCFCETWLDDSTLDCIAALNNYSIIRRDRVNGRGSGLLMFITSSLPFITLDITHLSISHNYSDTEFLPVLLPSLNALIVQIYHPYWGASPAHDAAAAATIDICEWATSSSGPGNSSTLLIILTTFVFILIHS
jgi:hypothetical protein